MQFIAFGDCGHVVVLVVGSVLGGSVDGRAGKYMERNKKSSNAKEQHSNYQLITCCHHQVQNMNVPTQVCFFGGYCIVLQLNRIVD